MWLSWLERHPINQKVVGLIPGQGTYLGCSSVPWSGHKQEATDQSFSLTSMFLSLCLPLSPSLSKSNEKNVPWLMWLSGLSGSLRTKGLLVRFPVRAYAWVVGQVPSGGRARDNHTLVFLSSFPSL